MRAVPSPCLCLVTSRRAACPEARTLSEEIAALDRLLEDAVAAGVDLIQVREPDLEAAPLRDLVLRAVRLARGVGVRIVVNDRLDVSLTAGADGVHLRADAPPHEPIRALCPSGFLLGRSVHDVEEARAHGPTSDYLVFGTVFPSASKPAGAPAAGLTALRRAAAATATPVLAIGGIEPGNARACLDAGAAGVAAIGVFLPEGRAPGALGVARATRELRAAMAAI